MSKHFTLLQIIAGISAGGISFLGGKYLASSRLRNKNKNKSTYAHEFDSSRSSRDLVTKWEDLNVWTFKDYVKEIQKKPEKIPKMELRGCDVFGINLGFGSSLNGYYDGDFFIEKCTKKDAFEYKLMYNRVEPKADLNSIQNINKTINKTWRNKNLGTWIISKLLMNNKINENEKEETISNVKGNVVWLFNKYSFVEFMEKFKTIQLEPAEWVDIKDKVYTIIDLSDIEENEIRNVEIDQFDVKDLNDINLKIAFEFSTKYQGEAVVQGLAENGISEILVKYDRTNDYYSRCDMRDILCFHQELKEMNDHPIWKYYNTDQTEMFVVDWDEVAIKKTYPSFIRGSVSGNEMADMIRDKGNCNYAVVDCRLGDSDYLDPHIEGCYSANARLMYEHGKEYVEKWKEYDHVIFHCHESCNRGPSTLTVYQSYLNSIYPDSKQRVSILSGGMKTFEKQFPELVKPKQDNQNT